MENFHLLLHAHWGHELLPLPSTGRGPWEGQEFRVPEGQVHG